MGKLIPDLPILGEPLIAEFANTLYIDHKERIDVLDHPAWIAAWLQQAPCAAALGAPRRFASAEGERLRLLRDAIRGLLLSKRGEESTVDVAVINDAARAGHSRRVLERRRRGGVGVVAESVARPFEVFLSAIATSVIDAVEYGDLDLIKVCSRPECNMFYFRNHHRRRYCNERCANADRQARYNRRLHHDAT